VDRLFSRKQYERVKIRKTRTEGRNKILLLPQSRNRTIEIRKPSSRNRRVRMFRFGFMGAVRRALFRVFNRKSRLIENTRSRHVVMYSLSIRFGVCTIDICLRLPSRFQNYQNNHWPFITNNEMMDLSRRRWINIRVTRGILEGNGLLSNVDFGPFNFFLCFFFLVIILL